MTGFPLPVIGFCACSGTGKTTLLRHLIPLLRERGLRVGLVKHAHQGFEPDQPGKDSYELRKAGAAQTLVVSRRRMAWIAEFPEQTREPTLEQALDAIRPEELDLVLVEGFKSADIPKIELHRRALGRPLFCARDPRVVAVASDDPALDLGPSSTPLLDINAPGAIAEFIVECLRQAGEDRSAD